jgi:phosphoribosyl-ATP pyrophosphohydrolase/phosphoribosyl-AMP cyclohydrolase
VEIDLNQDPKLYLYQLEALIQERKKNPKEGSYTNHLFNKGINKIAQKVGEEAVELVIEAKDSNKDLFLGETADLLYHLLVLLVEKGYTLEEVIQVLKERHSK